MKYYITFESEGFSSSLLGVSGRSEHTWTATEETLPEKLRDLAKNRHKLIRIIKGEEVQFVQEIKIIGLEAK